jgi:putative tricarboxylic transport membrane protein
VRNIDIVSAIALILVSALVVVATADLPYWSEYAPGPAFAARWVAAAGFLVGGLMLVQALRSRSVEKVEWPDAAGRRNVLLCVLALGLLVALLQVLGSALGGFLFLLAFLLFVARRSLLASLATALVTTALVQGVFVLWLGVDLPKGIISF